jgi:hypothetical protein
MRRDGLTAHDSLWLFSGVAAFGNAANSYYNIELYKKTISFNAATGKFSTAGTSGGHSEWLFDASGKVTQTGDMIIAVNFTPGIPPTLDVRLWVSTATYNTYFGGALSPAFFNFTSNYSTSSGLYGYASIATKSGSTAFGAGVANFSGTPAADTTYSTPWGTTNSTVVWTPNYISTQFIEVGINITRMGVDPALYSTLNPCDPMYSDIFFASRSSNSFTAQLKDFVLPLTFTQPPVLDFTTAGDTLRCNHTAGTLTLTDKSTAAIYSWKTLGGTSIPGSGSDSSQLAVTKPGSYVVYATPAEGCPVTAMDTIVVPIDTFPPKPSAIVGMSSGQLDFYGGDPVASNYPTPFGGSQGLSYTWTGPNSFSSGTRNPVTDTAWGTYNLTVTEARNGCTATTSVTALAAMFEVLMDNALQLRGNNGGRQIDLHWQDVDAAHDRTFTVERSDGSQDFRAIGTGWLAFSDQQPLAGTNLYRLKVEALDGRIRYSPTVSVAFGRSAAKNIFLATSGPASPTLFVSTDQPCHGLLVTYNINGQILEKNDLSLGQGTNSIPVSNPTPSVRHSVGVLALFIDDRLVWCQKILN